MTWQHGTRYGWVKKGCRCDECHEARLRADYQRRERRKARAVADPSCVPHGAPHAYADYGCRCERCVEARWAEIRRQRGSQPARVFSDEEVALAMKFYATKGLKVAAEAANISTSTVQKWAKQRGIAVYKPPVRHGRSRYQHYGCRCDVCRKAMREYGYERRARGVPLGITHGRASVYSNYGCRCEPCRAAHAVKMKRNALRRKAREAL